MLFDFTRFAAVHLGIGKEQFLFRSHALYVHDDNLSLRKVENEIISNLMVRFLKCEMRKGVWRITPFSLVKNLTIVAVVLPILALDIRLS